MNRYTLSLALIILLQLTTKAQQEKQFITGSFVSAAKPTVFTAYTPLPNHPYLAGNYGPDKNADFYLRRSKNYRIVGWSTLGGGIILSGIGLLIANGDYATNDSGSSAAGVFTIAGAASGVVSIPFMIMASAYKHKARVVLDNKKTGVGVPAGVSKYITGITLNIPIGN